MPTISQGAGLTLELPWKVLRNHCCNHITVRGNIYLVESRKTIRSCSSSSSTDLQEWPAIPETRKACNSLTLLTKVIMIKKAIFPFQVIIQHSRDLKRQEGEYGVPHSVPTGFCRIEAHQPFQGHDKPLRPKREMPSMVLWCVIIAAIYPFTVFGDLILPCSPWRIASVLGIEQYIGSSRWSEHHLQINFHLREYMPHLSLAIAFRSASRSQSSVANSV